MDTVLQADFEH